MEDAPRAHGTRRRLFLRIRRQQGVRARDEKKATARGQSGRFGGSDAAQEQLATPMRVRPCQVVLTLRSTPDMGSSAMDVLRGHHRPRWGRRRLLLDGG